MVKGKKSKPLTRIGFIYHINMNEDPKTLPPKSWVCRAWIMNRAFEKAGLSLFSYTPQQVNPITGKVLGYTIRNNQFVLEIVDIPTFNYNFYLGFGKRTYPEEFDLGLLSDELRAWSVNRNIFIYPFSGIIDVARDKYETYKVIRAFDKNIQPETETLNDDPNQIVKFLKKSDIVFLKQREANRGTGITILKQSQGRGYSLTTFMENEKREIFSDELEKIVRVILKRTRDRGYLIQVGYDSLRIEGSAINIRAIMIKVGNQWEWTHEVMQGLNESPVSNHPSAGYLSYPIDGVLEKVIKDKSIVAAVTKKLKNASFGIMEYLDKRFDQKIGELVFDYVLDKNYEIHLAEINTKPGLPGEAERTVNFFEAKHYDALSEDYAKLLAESFKQLVLGYDKNL